MSDKLREKIKSVGTTLDDYVKGLPNFDQKVDGFIGKRRGADNNIILSSDGVVRLRNEVCVGCGSSDIVFNGTNPKVLESGLKIKLQRYLCNKCQCNFTTPLEGYLKKTSDTATKQ